MSSKDLQTIADAIDPTMLTLVDAMVTGYMARRYGITVEQMQASIDTEAHIRDSYERKMVRATMVLLGPAGFQMHKKQNTKPLAKPQSQDFTPADPGFKIPGMGK